MKLTSVLVSIVFLITTNAYSGTVGYPMPDGTIQTIIFNDKYSKKDFTQRNLLEATDLEGAVIYGSSFSQENPDTKVFPENVKKMTFYNCNLSNVLLPSDSVVVGGQKIRYKVQTDREDWILNTDNTPKEPINKEKYLNAGKSINPKDLPKEEVKDSIF